MFKIIILCTVSVSAALDIQWNRISL